MDASSHARATHRPGRGRVFDSIVDAIGNTPIVRLAPIAALSEGLSCGEFGVPISGHKFVGNFKFKSR